MARGVFILFIVIIICIGAIAIIASVENKKLIRKVEQDKEIIDSLEKEIHER